MSEQVNQSVEHKIFLRNYSELTAVLNTSITNLSTHFVSKQVITTEDEELIHQTPTDKAKSFLWKIESPLKVGFHDPFYILLEVMQHHGGIAVKSMATKLRKEIDEFVYSQSITNAHNQVKRLLKNDEVLNGVQVNFEKEIGRGSYAAVYEAEWKCLSCVVKVFHSTIVPNQSAISWKHHEREIQILQDIRHPNIIQLLGFVFDPVSNVLSIVMERMDSTLTTVLGNHSPLPFDLQVGILHDVAVGLNFLHSHTKPIIHRDLSSNNILLTVHLVAKISDLGLAKHLMSTETETGSNAAVGTQEYMPPEVLGTIPPQISPKTDIFSFGVILLQVATGKYPEVTGTINADAEIDRRKDHITMLENSNPLHPLCLQCLHNDSCERPSAKVLCDSLGRLSSPRESVICVRKELDMTKQSKEKLAHLYAKTQFQQNTNEISMITLKKDAKNLQEKLNEQKTQQMFYQIAHKQMKQKIAVLEHQLKESTERLTKMQEAQTSNSTPQNQLRKEIKSQKQSLQKTNTKDALTDLQQTSGPHQMKNETIAIKKENIKLQQELRKMGYQYDEVVAQNDQLRWDNQELRNVLDKVQSELQLFKTDLQFQDKTPADPSANNDRAYNYKSERDFAMTQVEDLQKQLHLLQQKLRTQRRIYDTDQSEAYRRIQALEAECTYLKNENTRLNTARPETHHRQFSEGDQTLFDTPVNPRSLSQNNQFNDGAAMLTPYMHSRQLSESTESSSDNESYGSSTNMCKYHSDHGCQYTDARSISQDHSWRNYVHCNWQTDGMLENSMSLSQPTTDEYYDSQPIIKDPRYLSQQYNQFYENTTYSPWAQYNSIPSSRSLPKELDKSTNRLLVYRSSSLGSRVVSQPTIHLYKKVMTSHGESNVMCKAIHAMSELRKGEKVVVHRYYHDVNEYGTVRALNVTINNKPWYVGVELDLPGGNPDSDGAINGVRYFKCKPQHAVFIHLKHIFKIQDENSLYHHIQ